MNRILLEPGEVCDGVATLRDERFAHIRDVLRAKPGERLRAGVVDGPRYEAEVAKNRAAGTHVENIRNVTELNDDDLRAEAKRLLDGEGAADGSVSRSTH